MENIASEIWNGTSLNITKTDLRNMSVKSPDVPIHTNVAMHFAYTREKYILSPYDTHTGSFPRRFSLGSITIHIFYLQLYVPNTVMATT